MGVPSIMERPAAVENLIQKKFTQLSGDRRSRPWTHMGSPCHTVYLATKYTFTTDQVARARVKEQGKVLDLGAGTGDLLASLHRTLNIPYSRLLGISAVDH